MTLVLIWIGIVFLFPAIAVFCLLVFFTDRWRKVGWLAIFILSTLGYNVLYGEYLDDNFRVPYVGPYFLALLTALAITIALWITRSPSQKTWEDPAAATVSTARKRSSGWLATMIVLGLLAAAYYAVVGFEFYGFIRFAMQVMPENGMPRWDHSGILLYVFVFLLLWPLLPFWALRRAYIRQNPRSAPGDPSSITGVLPDVIFYALIGTALPAYMLWYGLFGGVSGEWIFGMLGLTVVLGIAIIIAFSIGKPSTLGFRAISLLVPLVVGTTLLGYFAWRTGHNVVEEGNRLALGAAHCIENNRGIVTDPLQLTILNTLDFRTPWSWRGSGHAMLVISDQAGTRNFLWSHSAQTFEPTRSRATHCEQSQP